MRRAAGWSIAIVGATIVGSLIAPGSAQAAGWVSVAAGTVLNVRSGPSTGSSIVRTVEAGSPLAVICQVTGQAITGTERTTAAWNRLEGGGYVTDAYVAWPGSPPGSCLAGSVVRVAGHLNQRANTSTLVAPVGTVVPDAGVDVVCQLGGESIAGTSGTSEMWDRLSNGNFVADAYVAWPTGRPDVPWCSLTESSAPASGEPFIAWTAPMAQQTYAEYGVPASVSIAQAILESGWGRSALTVDGNSYFGMKCFGSPGRIATGCRPYQTYECDAGCYSTSASFRVYTTVAASFADHAVQLATLPRYANAFNYSNNPDQFAREVHWAGYATSPSYADDLINLMRQYDLYRFDAIW